MQNVARHLQVHSIRIKNDPEFDVYARSSFNRYYYALFLLVRSKLISVNPEWNFRAHASFPEFLKGTVVKEIKQALTRARKIGDSDFINHGERAKSAAIDLSDIMVLANTVRKIADYQPETLVTIDGDRFRLSGVSINDAHSWVERADVYMTTIELAFREMS